MALIKQVIDENTGSAGSYGKLIRMDYNRVDGTTQIYWGWWSSKEFCDMGKNPVITTIRTIPAGTSPELALAVQEFAQTYIHSLPEFSDADLE